MWRDEARLRRSNQRALRHEINASDLTPSLAVSYEDLLSTPDASIEESL